MLVLALDTSSPAVLAGLVELDDNGTSTVLAHRGDVDGRRHGELLSPAIGAVLDETGRSSGDVDAVVAGLGPGPFTGLRVGLVTAASFADAVAVPAYGVCSLDAIAVVAEVDGPVLVATDARRREVYWARYDDGRRRTAGPSVTRPSDVDTSGMAAVVGAGGALYPDVLGPSLSGPSYPDLGALAGLAADRVLGRAPGEVLVPLYLRRPDAVEPAGLVRPVP